MHIPHLGEERIFMMASPLIFINFIIFIMNLRWRFKIIVLIIVIAANLILNIKGLEYFFNTGGSGDKSYYISSKIVNTKSACYFEKNYDCAIFRTGYIDIKLEVADFIRKEYSDTGAVIFVQD